MTKDLEETLSELGPGYRAVVDRVLGAYAPMGNVAESAPPCRAVAPSRRARAAGWSVAYLVAASLLVLAGLAVVFREPEIRATSEAKLVYTVAYAADAASLRRIVASQREDGSWANDFITRQNAAALRGAGRVAGARTAYKKAVRYLRSKGLRPLSDEELKLRGDFAARSLASN